MNELLHSHSDKRAPDDARDAGAKARLSAAASSITNPKMRYAASQAVAAPPRAFGLLPTDDAGLAERGLLWSTKNENSRRYLIMHNVTLPVGFNTATATTAMEIPPSYPAG